LENVRKEVERKGIFLLKSSEQIVGDRDADDVVGRRATCVIADVTQESEVQGMLATVVKELGELNVSHEPRKPVGEDSQQADYGGQCRNYSDQISV
jgi:hypothetical protein